MEYFKKLLQYGQKCGGVHSSTNAVEYFVYATDDSGSTDFSQYYNSNGLETLKQFKQEVDASGSVAANVKYLHWGSTCREVNEDHVEQRYIKGYANGGGTEPATIIKWIQKHVCSVANAKLKLLYIVTDGLILSEDVDRCSRAMKRQPFVFERVVFHAINHYEKSIDLSVASVFLTNAECTIYCNRKIINSINLAVPYNYDDVTPQNFEEKANDLMSYIKLQFITSNSSDAKVLEEIKKLKSLRDRLMAYEVSGNQEPIFGTKNREEFVAIFKSSKYYKSLYSDVQTFKIKVDKLICTVINYLHNDKKSYDFDALRVEQYCEAISNVEEKEVDDIEYGDAQIIEFPDCILDNERGVPAILLTNVNLLSAINDNVSLTKFKKTLEFPLYYMASEDVKQSIEYFYNVETIKSLLEHKISVSPRARKPFTGALVPTPEFDVYNDYVLLKTYFNGKLVPVNKGLMYYVLFKHMTNAEYINADVCEYFRHYVIHRIVNTICPIAFTRQPLEPQMMVSLPAALWYTVDIATELFAKDPIFFAKERLREYTYYAGDMITMLEWCCYTLDAETIKSRSDTLLTINALKRVQGYDNKLMFLLRLVFEQRHGFIVDAFKNKKEIEKLNLLDIDHTKMIDEKVLSRSVNLNNYAFFYNKMTETKFNVIDMRTMRPRFVCESDGGGGEVSFYDHLFKLSRNVSADNNNDIQLEPVTKLDLRKTVSLYKMYIAYVDTYRCYPLLLDYQEFVCERYRVRDGKAGIFSWDIIENIAQVHLEYNKLTTNMSVDEFLSRAKPSINRTQRIVMESDKSLDLELANNFVLSAERRVCLI